MKETVSPELALVDPELAARLRLEETQRLARLEAVLEPAGVAELVLEPPRPAQVPPAGHAATPRFRLILATALGVIVGFGGAAASIKVVHLPVSDVRTEVLEVPAPTLARSAITHKGRSEKNTTGNDQVAAQRIVLGLLPAAARASEVPRSIVDPVTGLVRDLTTVRCPHPTPPVFECTVATATLTTSVAVRRSRDGKFTIAHRLSGTVRAGRDVG